MASAAVLEKQQFDALQATTISSPEKQKKMTCREKRLARMTEEEKKRPHKTECFQWIPTDNDQLAKAERRMLARISDMYESRTVAGLNTIQYINPLMPDRHTILIHGFGGGLANWLPTWKALAPYTSIYAIDLPGFARSIRPDGVKFTEAEDAIEFMTDSIYSWMKEMNFVTSSPAPSLSSSASSTTTGGSESSMSGDSDGEDQPLLTESTTTPVKVNLVGHSFGADICANFAVKYPSRVEKLVLTDPWGVNGVDPNFELPLRWRLALKLFYAGNPLGVLRGAGPFGPGLFSKARGDFANRWAPHIDDTKDFYDYTYHCNAQSPPVGEQAFQTCCTGPACAKMPLEKLLPEALPKSVFLGVIYGANTWMKRENGVAMLQKIKAQGGSCHPRVELIPDAAHQVMSDNAPDYNTTLLDVLDFTTAL